LDQVKNHPFRHVTLIILIGLHNMYTFRSYFQCIGLR